MNRYIRKAVEKVTFAINIDPVEKIAILCNWNWWIYIGYFKGFALLWPLFSIPSQQFKGGMNVYSFENIEKFSRR